MNSAAGGYALFLTVVRQALFWLALAIALIALMDWLVRTRRISPFSAVARFFRRFVDPLMAPIERRVVRAGSMPTSAPLWTLVVVVVGGLLLLAVLDFVARFVAELFFGLSSPGRFGVLLISWVFSLLKIALIVRVVSSWFRISPYSRWIRWSFTLTEWMLAPLRRVIPAFGPIDVTPLVAFILLAILESLILG